MTSLTAKLPFLQLSTKMVIASDQEETTLLSSTSRQQGFGPPCRKKEQSLNLDVAAMSSKKPAVSRAALPSVPK